LSTEVADLHHRQVKPFFRNVKKELTKSPKVYFLDLGFLSLAKGIFPEEQKLEGGVLENACFLRLKELDLVEQVRFWRSSSGAEVDFVLTSPKSGKVIPVEVKFAAPANKTVGKSLISFLTKYQSGQAIIWDYETEEREFLKTGAKIQILPYFLLPKIE